MAPMNKATFVAPTGLGATDLRSHTWSAGAATIMERITPALVTAIAVGLLMGFWLGAYLIHLYKDESQKAGARLVKGSSTIVGMGGLPNASFFIWLEDVAIWCLLSYACALLIPAFLAYWGEMKKPRWAPTDPKRFEP